MKARSGVSAITSNRQQEGNMELHLVRSADTKQYNPSKKPELSVVYCTEKELPVYSHTVVIKNKSLALRYPGGIKAFMDRHKGLSNGRITVKCFLGFYDDVYELLKDLKTGGFKLTRDYIYFNADRHILEVKRKRSLGVRCLNKADTGVNWLQGRLSLEMMYIQYHEY